MNNYHVEPIGGVFIGYYGNGESRDPANKAHASGRSVVGKRGKSVKRRHGWELVARQSGKYSYTLRYNNDWCCV